MHCGILSTALVLLHHSQNSWQQLRARIPSILPAIGSDMALLVQKALGTSTAILAPWAPMASLASAGCSRSSSQVNPHLMSTHLDYSAMVAMAPPGHAHGCEQSCPLDRQEGSCNVVQTFHPLHQQARQSPYSQGGCSGMLS